MAKKGPKVNLLTDFLSEDEARDRVRAQAESFGPRFVKEHPVKATQGRVQSLLRDLERGLTWHVFDYLALENAPGAGRGSWAKAAFSPEELQEIMDITVNTAMLIPFRESPGHQHGYQILHEQFARHSSIFYGIADGRLLRTLQNGRFWQYLPELRLSRSEESAIVQDVLMKNPKVLDPEFARTGFNLFYLNDGANAEFMDLDGLTDRAIDRYHSLVSELHKRRRELGISSWDIELLMAPYALAAISTVDGIIPRFEEGSRGDFKTRLQDRTVSWYLTNSHHLREKVAGDIASEMADGETSRLFQFDVLSSVPNPTEMMDRVLQRIGDQSYPLKRLTEDCEKEGITLGPYLSASGARRIYETAQT